VCLALASCAGGSGGSPGTGGGANDVLAVTELHIVIVPRPPDLPFDPRSARLAQATRELTSLAGHPIEIELDAALLPEWRSSFEEELIRAIENIGRDLLALKEEHPRVFERAAEKLQKVACRYRASSDRAEARFADGVLTILEPARDALVPRGVVQEALVLELEAYLDAVYRKKTPDDVPPGDRAAYFEYLTRTRPGYGNLVEGRARKEKPPSNEFDDPHADTVLKIVRLAELVGPDGPLGRGIRVWLVEEARYRSNAFQSGRAPPQGTLWRRADEAYARWLGASAASLTDEQKSAIFRATSGAESYPGFDRFAFRLAIIDQWRAEGHKTEGEGKHFELLDEVACPHTTRASDGRRDRNRGCNEVFYDQAPPGLLADALLRRGDPIFVEEAFTNLSRAESAKVVALWRALLQNAPLWSAATRVVVEQLLDERPHTEAIVNEANRLWRDAPDKRGGALYVVAWTKRGYDAHYADPFFADFAKRYGEPVSAQAFASFLDQSPRAVMLAPLVWPALGRGFSRAQPLVARLDRFVADPVVKATPGEPQRTLRAVAVRTCAENGTEDLRRLHAWIEQRVRAHAEESASLATLRSDTSACRTRAEE
jgi:hypothetical protein